MVTPLLSSSSVGRVPPAWPRLSTYQCAVSRLTRRRVKGGQPRASPTSWRVLHIMLSWSEHDDHVKRAHK